jgi:predicted RNA-binding protein with PIN domain
VTVTRQWFVDGNNVMGARPDGWWNDPAAAAHRLTQAVAEWCRTHDDTVTVVFDGSLEPRTAQLAGGNLEVTGTQRRGRDAADDHIVELVSVVDRARSGDVVVVTSDRGLRARLPEAVEVLGAGTFRSIVERSTDAGSHQ